MSSSTDSEEEYDVPTASIQPFMFEPVRGGTAQRNVNKETAAESDSDYTTTSDSDSESEPDEIDGIDYQLRVNQDASEWCVCGHCSIIAGAKERDLVCCGEKRRVYDVAHDEGMYHCHQCS